MKKKGFAGPKQTNSLYLVILPHEEKKKEELGAPCGSERRVPEVAPWVKKRMNRTEAAETWSRSLGSTTPWGGGVGRWGCKKVVKKKRSTYLTGALPGGSPQ